MGCASCGGVWVGGVGVAGGSRVVWGVVEVVLGGCGFVCWGFGVAVLVGSDCLVAGLGSGLVLGGVGLIE